MWQPASIDNADDLVMPQGRDLSWMHTPHLGLTATLRRRPCKPQNETARQPPFHLMRSGSKLITTAKGDGIVH
jgi:hypothetical protein